MNKGLEESLQKDIITLPLLNKLVCLKTVSDPDALQELGRGSSRRSAPLQAAGFGAGREAPPHAPLPQEFLFLQERSPLVGNSANSDPQLLAQKVFDEAYLLPRGRGPFLNRYRRRKHGCH